MKNSETLHTLLVDEVIPDVEQFMKKMQEHIDTHDPSPEMQEDQQGIRMIHQHFLEILNAIENNEIAEENCEQLIGEISMLRKMGGEMPVKPTE